MLTGLDRHAAFRIARCATAKGAVRADPRLGSGCRRRGTETNRQRRSYRSTRSLSPHLRSRGRRGPGSGAPLSILARRSADRRHPRSPRQGGGGRFARAIDLSGRVMPFLGAESASKSCATVDGGLRLRPRFPGPRDAGRSLSRSAWHGQVGPDAAHMLEEDDFAGIEPEFFTTSIRRQGDRHRQRPCPPSVGRRSRHAKHARCDRHLPRVAITPR